MADASLPQIQSRLSSAEAYHPYSAETFADWALEAGDVITISRDGESMTVPVHSANLVWRGKQQISLNAGGNRERDPIATVSKKKYARGGYGMRSQQGIYKDLYSEDGFLHSHLEFTESRLRTEFYDETNSLRSEFEITASHLRAEFEDLGKSLRSEFEVTASHLRAEFEDMGNSLRGEFEVTASHLRAEFDDLGNSLRGEFEVTASHLRTEFEDDLNSLRSEFEVTASHLRTEFEDLANSLRGEFEVTASHLRTEFEDTANSLRSEFEVTASHLRTEFEDIANSLRGEFEVTASHLRAEYEDVANSLRGEFEVTASHLRTEFDDIANSLRGEFEVTASHLRAEYEDVANSLRGEFEVTASHLRAEYEDVANSLRGEFEVTASHLRTEFNDLGNSLRGEFEVTASHLRTEFEDLGNSLRSEFEVTASHLRTEFEDDVNSLRGEFEVTASHLRTEFTSMGTSLRTDLEVTASGFRTTLSGVVDENGNVTAASIATAINDQGQAGVSIDGSWISIGNQNATTVINGKLSAEDITTELIKTKVEAADRIDVRAMYVPNGTTGTGTTNWENIKNSLYDVQVIADPDVPGQYILQKKTWQTSNWVNAGTFKRATSINSLTGDWSGSVLTVTTSPDTGNTYTVGFNGSYDASLYVSYDSSRTTEKSGKTLIAPVKVYTTGSTAPYTPTTRYETTVSVDASEVWGDGYGAAQISLDWSSGTLTASKVTSGASANPQKLRAGDPSWSGNFATVNVYAYTSNDQLIGDTGFTVGVDASDRYNAGWGDAYSKVSIPTSSGSDSYITIETPKSTPNSTANSRQYSISDNGNNAVKLTTVVNSSPVTVATYTHNQYSAGQNSVNVYRYAYAGGTGASGYITYSPTAGSGSGITARIYCDHETGSSGDHAYVTSRFTDDNWNSTQEIARYSVYLTSSGNTVSLRWDNTSGTVLATKTITVSNPVLEWNGSTGSSAGTNNSISAMVDGTAKDTEYVGLSSSEGTIYLKSSSTASGVSSGTVVGKITDSNLAASNIKSGVRIFGIDGTYTGTTNVNVYRYAYSAGTGSSGYITYSPDSGTGSGITARIYCDHASGTSGDHAYVTSRFTDDNWSSTQEIARYSVYLTSSGNTVSLRWDNTSGTVLATKTITVSNPVLEWNGSTGSSAGTNNSISARVDGAAKDTEYVGLSSSSGIIYLKSSSTASGVSSGTVVGKITDSNLTASNIKSGVSVFGVTGTYTGTTNVNVYRYAYGAGTGSSGYITYSPDSGTGSGKTARIYCDHENGSSGDHAYVTARFTDDNWSSTQEVARYSVYLTSSGNTVSLRWDNTSGTVLATKTITATHSPTIVDNIVTATSSDPGYDHTPISGPTISANNQWCKFSVQCGSTTNKFKFGVALSDNNWKPENIKNGVSIFGVTGTYSGSSSHTVTITTNSSWYTSSSQTESAAQSAAATAMGTSTSNLLHITDGRFKNNSWIWFKASCGTSTKYYYTKIA